MTALSTEARLPLLGYASQDELLDVCRQAVDAARLQRRPILASWATRIRRSDPADLWRHGRTQTDRSLLWQSAWDRGFLVALGTAHDVTGHGGTRITDTRDAWRELVKHAVIGGHPGDWLPTGTGPLLVGGFSFAAADDDHTAAGARAPDAPLPPDARLPSDVPLPPDVPLPEALMWVPALQLRGSTVAGSMSELRLNAIVDPDDAPDRVAKSLVHLAEQCLPEGGAPQAADAPSRPRTEPPAVRELPPAREWKDLVARAVDRIRSGAFEKVVVAREVRVTADVPFDIPAALERLRRSYPDATVFAVDHGPHIFIGATPEYLVRWNGRDVRALGLAGTAPRGTTDSHDAALEKQLTESAKIRHEHDVVVRMLVDALRPTCANVDAGTGPRVVKLANVQHLATVVEGRGVRPGLGALEFVERLHPTPALAGHPRAESLDWLRRNEGLARGWYAGTVGWTDIAGRGEFAVAIRCALVRGGTALLYTGCGIVADSDPEEEYQETRVKLRPMREALGLD